MTRVPGVAWMAVGCARGAYEHALAYALEREKFGRPIGGFQLVQDLLVRMLGNITHRRRCAPGCPSYRKPAKPAMNILIVGRAITGLSVFV